ncbi:MAG: hypothetical protein Q8934_22605 [Bacillota bacterium]|nr:hypothetical protein [Bacillota bacterium]
MIMLRDLEHPANSEINRKGFVGSECSAYAGTDYFGTDILANDDIAIDGDVIILKDNLERYLYEVYGITFQTID